MRYKTKKAAAENAQKELDGLMASYLPIIKEQETTIQNINTNINNEITSLKRGAYGGLAARMDALDRLGSQSEAIFWANIFKQWFRFSGVRGSWLPSSKTYI